MLRVRRVHDPEDAALRELSNLLQVTFADPDVVLGLDRMQAFLEEPDTDHRPFGEAPHADRSGRPRESSPESRGGLQSRGATRTSPPPARHFCVLVAEDAGLVLGGTVFSYVPATNCGFSEYLLIRKDHHRQGLGRRLFDARRAVLDDLAGRAGQASCHGLFIEADNPVRTPPAIQARERETAMDTLARLQVFAHLGFARVDVEYAQPSLGPGKRPVTYLDLLFAAWDVHAREHASVPARWVAETLQPIWASWAPETATAACAALRQRLGEAPVALLNLPQ